jgi:hypothetical protein
MMLKDHITFMPPKERDAIDLEEEVETEEEETVPNNVAVPENPTAAAANGVAMPSASDVSVVSGSVNRGRAHEPGPGRKKTKKDVLQAKYTQSKMRNVDAMVEIAKRKAKDLGCFVRSNVHTNAAKNAYLGYHGTTNRRLKSKYEKKLQNILNYETSESEDEEGGGGGEDGGADEDEDPALPLLIGV